MALRFLDRAMMRTATAGAGTVTLGAAVLGFQTFASAGIADGDTLHYVIEDDGVTGAWELGLGTYTAAGTTLARTTLIASSTGSKLSLSGNARVFVSALASDFTDAPGFRNPMRRNGGFEVWQRGAGGAASMAVPASSTIYTADGWYLSTGVNQACTVSQQAGLTNGSQWSAKVQRNAGQTGVGGMQFGFPLDTDELYPLLGQFVRLSLVAKAGANWSPASGTLSMFMAVGTGAPVKRVVGFTGETFPINSGGNLTTTSTLYQFSSAAIVPVTTRQADIVMFWTPVGTAGADDSFSIDDVQPEIVADANHGASAFERLNFQEQWLLCQRQFWKSFPYGTAPANNVGMGTGEIDWPSVAAAAATTRGSLRMPVPMRIAPSGILYNPSAANGQIRNDTLGTDCSASAAAIDANHVSLTGTTPASTVATNRMAVHVALDAGI